MNDRHQDSNSKVPSRGGEGGYDWLTQPASEGQASPEILYATALRVGVDAWEDSTLAEELESLAETLASGLSADEDPDAGRVFQVTDLVEEPEGRVRLALSLARNLRERGLEVILVDADLRFVGLARHLDESLADAEGFVDALEYGASAAALLKATPREGVRVLPVGSYRPDHTHLLSDDALRRLVRQLRAAADVVFLLAPAWTADGRFHPLLVHSDQVILGFDLDRSSAEPLAALRRYLDGLGIPLAPLVVRVTDDPADGAVEVALEENRQTTAAASDRSSGPSPIESPYGIRPELGDEASSPGVRRLLIGLVLVLVAFVGWWGWTEMRAAPSKTLPLEVADLSPAPEVATDLSAAGLDSETAASADSSGAGVSAAAAAMESVSIVEPEEQAIPVAEEPPRSELGSSSASPSPAEELSSERLPAELFLAVHDGWALHPWSFADSSDAAAAMLSLERQGMHPVVHSATVKGRLWYRVLVGNFESREQAWAARELLSERVRTDWVGVVRVR